MDDESGDDEIDWLTSGWGGESRRDKNGEWWGWRNESGSWFQRGDDAYLNERSVIFKEQMARWQERVTTDEERVLRDGWREKRFTPCRNRTFTDVQFTLLLAKKSFEKKFRHTSQNQHFLRYIHWPKFLFKVVIFSTELCRKTKRNVCFCEATVEVFGIDCFLRDKLWLWDPCTRMVKTFQIEHEKQKASEMANEKKRIVLQALKQRQTNGLF